MPKTSPNERSSMKKYRHYLLLLVTVLSSGCATTPQNKEDALADNLGFLYFVVHGTYLNTKYCSDEIPALAADLNSAYDEWKKRSPTLHAEIESGWQEMKRLVSKKYGKPLTEVEADTNKLLSRQAQVQRQQLVAGGPQNFERRCSNHLAQLRDPRADVERRYPKEVAAMRLALQPK